MSFRVTQLIIDHSPHRDLPGAILVRLARHARDDGSNAFCSVPTIMSKTGKTRRSVQRALRLLETASPPAIERTGIHPSGTIVYRVLIDPSWPLGGRHPRRGGGVTHAAGGASPTPPEETSEEVHEEKRDLPEGSGADEQPAAAVQNLDWGSLS